MLRYLCVICWWFVVYVVELLVECRLVSLFGLRCVLGVGYYFVVFGAVIVGYLVAFVASCFAVWWLALLAGVWILLF